MFAVPYEDGDMYPCVVMVVMMKDAMKYWSKMCQWPEYNWCQSGTLYATIGGNDSTGKQLTVLTGSL